MITGTTGQAAPTGATPLFGRPGMVLPVTVEEAVSLEALGSTGVLDVRVAVFVAGVVPVTVTTSCSVAVEIGRASCRERV